MKTTIQFIITLLFCCCLNAQNGINYKAVIKDTNGNVVANENIDIVFNIQHESVSIYSESQQVMTDNNGIAIAIIGNGTPSLGTFDTIDWKLRDLELNVQIDFGDGLVGFGNSPFNAVPYAIHTLKPQGLEAVDEGNGIGWRLADRNPDFFGSIGLNAVDLSYNNTSSTVIGATGERSLTFGAGATASGNNAISLGLLSKATQTSSVAIGYLATSTGNQSVAIGSFATASGNSSTAMGSATISSGFASMASGQSGEASGDNSVAMGYQTTASGFTSIAMGSGTMASAANSTAIGSETTASAANSTSMGSGTIASGTNSTVLGFNTEASGNASTAMGGFSVASGDRSIAMGSSAVASGNASIATGLFTEASGEISTAMGLGTNAEAYASTAIGRYNTGGGSPNSWFTNDPLFEIGNGSGNINRSNALTVLKNGNTGIGTNNPQELLHISGGRLRIGSETIEDTGSDRLSFNADLLPDINEGMQLGNSSFRWLGLWAADGTINTSDRRNKTNIKTISYGLTEVLKMNPVSYNWKNRKNQDTKLGLIAQDLLELVPEVVKTHEWEKDEVSGELTKKELDRLGVYYSDLIPVLINAIKEQQKIIDSQGVDLKTSKTNYDALLSRIENLEKKSLN